MISTANRSGRCSARPAVSRRAPLAEAFAETDRHPPTFDPESHVVSIPEPFKKSLRAWQSGEWFRIGLEESVGGGVPAPAMLAWAINEFALGAQPAAFMYLAGPVLASILYEIGNEQQRQWAVQSVERNWGRDHGADRARRRLRCGCGPHQGHPAARRHLAPGRGQAVHHQR